MVIENAISIGVASSTASIASEIVRDIPAILAVVAGIIALNVVLFLLFGKDLLGGWK